MRFAVSAAALVAVTACAAAPGVTTVPIASPSPPATGSAAPPPLVPAAAETPHIDWQELTIEAAHFGVRMPGMPHEEEAVSHPPLAAHLFVVELDHGDVTYSAGYTAFAPPLDVLDDESRLDHVRNGIVEGRGGTLVFERRLRLGAASGRELRVTFDEHVLLARIFAVGKNVVEAGVAMPEAHWSDADAAVFLDSMKLLEAP